MYLPEPDQRRTASTHHVFKEWLPTIGMFTRLFTHERQRKDRRA
jgi:hypothetical protein